MYEKRNILYVEDNEGDVELLKMCIDRYCSTLNIALDVVETVDEAKEFFIFDKHIIVLIDWNLPDGEGIDVAKFIRKKQGRHPIFLLSGVFTDRQIKCSEKLTSTICLEKSYDKHFIEKIIPYLNLNQLNTI
jgi:DNA-binding response OmpR family regulator